MELAGLNIPTELSPRLQVVYAAKWMLSRIRGGRYFVRRGVINWSTFDFGAHPYGVAIFCDESTLLREDDSAMILTFEIGMKMSDETDEIQDTGIDELTTDAEEVFEALDSVEVDGCELIRKLDRDTGRVAEFSDADRKVQGIIASVRVEF